MINSALQNQLNSNKNFSNLILLFLTSTPSLINILIFLLTSLLFGLFFPINPPIEPLDKKALDICRRRIFKVILLLKSKKRKHSLSSIGIRLESTSFRVLKEFVKNLKLLDKVETKYS